LYQSALKQKILVFLILRKVEHIKFPFDGVYKIIKHRYGYIVSGDEDIDQKKHEIFSVPKTYTVVDPRTMMVHVEHASVTS
jgi:hypothetical protein